MGIDVLGIDIMGVDILGIDIVALPLLNVASLAAHLLLGRPSFTMIRT